MRTNLTTATLTTATLATATLATLMLGLAGCAGVAAPRGALVASVTVKFES